MFIFFLNLSMLNHIQSELHRPWKHSVSILLVHWFLQNLAIDRLWKWNWNGQRKTQQRSYATEQQQICSSYHNSVCTDDDIRGLQVLLEQINAQYLSFGGGGGGGVAHVVYDHTARGSTHRGHPLSHLQGLLFGRLHGVLVRRFELAFVKSFFEPGRHHLKS